PAGAIPTPAPAAAPRAPDPIEARRPEPRAPERVEPRAPEPPVAIEPPAIEPRAPEAPKKKMSALERFRSKRRSDDDVMSFDGVLSESGPDASASAPTVDAPAADEPAADEPAADEPAADASATDDELAIAAPSDASD